MSVEKIRICQTCGTALAPQDEFCPVCAFRGALQTDDAATELSEALVPERRFGNYEILTDEDGSLLELGRGAMGITYKAFDVDLRRFAALKVISPRYLADEGARSRFLREARAAGSVRHPNVASVFQLGTSQENYFYAMEFVEGETLASLIKRSTCLDAKLALEIVAQVAAGLDAIHKQNLVHRDIKPSNIMVSSATDGAESVKIIDLGLAKTLTESESQAAISIPGAFAGTPEFASPEQFTGTDVDIRSDLYSLGITLWQMLTGQPPFRGAPNAVMHQHLTNPLPLENLQEVSQPVVALVEVLLRKDPARRFQTPAELSKVLPTVVHGIESGQSVRKTIRVFFSSSTEVQIERNLANRIVRAIAGEFDLAVSESGSGFQRLTELDPIPEIDGNERTEDQEHQKFVLCLHFWDYSGQGEVRRLPEPGNFDLVVCLLGNQLGLPVHPDLRLPDGGIPTSGTEYEIAWAAEHATRNHGLPVLRVYRNKSKPAVLLEPRPEREASAKEADSERDFLAEWEDKRKGTTDFSRYKTLEEFEEQFRSHFRDFVADQIKQDAGPKLPERSVRRWKSSPFRGLNVFDFEHAPIFFGRTKAIGEVLEALEQQRKVWRPFVLIVGGSGSGKSSLVRAGVLPQITQPGTIEGIGLWRRAVTRPGGGGSGGDCFDALANSLLDSAALPGLENPESTNAVEELAAELRDHPDAVALRVRDALDNAAREWKMQRDIYLRAKDEKSRSRGTTTVSGVIVPRRPAEAPELPKARLALVVDQLEELFTSGFSTDIQQKYVSAIAGLVQSGRVFVLATLRSDFYLSYQQFPELTELTRPSGKVDLRPPTAYEIGNMIRLPAEAAGLRFEQDNRSGQRLDEGLRDAAASTPESLPLLEHVLSLLYDQQFERGDGLLCWDDYRDLGELKGALAKYAEAVFATLQPTEQLAFPLVMRHLVTLGQGEEEAPNRRSAPYRDFIASDSADGKSGAKGFVDLFIAKRLFIADTDPRGEVNVSVAHEALLKEWQRIREWLAENRDFLRMRDRLESSLKLWLSRGKQKDDLLGPGLPLAEGEKLLKDFAPSLSQTQTDYVRTSIAEQKRRQRIRERIRYGVMAGITAALIVAVIFGIVSYRQYRRAERAKTAADQAKTAADQAAKRATLARDEAQKLINFMTLDLRDKLKPIGRLDLLDEVNLRVRAYYDHVAGTDSSPQILWQRSIALINYGDIRKDRGDHDGALKSYNEAFEIQTALVNRDPKNSDWQRDLSTSLDKIGDVLKVQGNIDNALKNYEKSLAIHEKLAAKDTNNALLQSALSASFERIGELKKARGDIDGALECYKRSLLIREKLVSSDPANASDQLDLSWSYAEIGDMLSSKGDSEEALRNYRSAQVIRQDLVSKDPGNANLQHDLSSCLAEIGHELAGRGQWQDALDAYRASLAITQTLAEKDPTNTMWQRDLSISLERVGDALQGRHEYDDALKSYHVALAIRQELAHRDPASSLWQSDLSWSYQEIGDVLFAQKAFEDALQSYRDSLETTERLAKSDPTNNQLKSDLAVICEKTGEAFSSLGNVADALRSFRESLSLCEKLTEIDSQNVDWTAEEAQACFQVGMSLLRTEAKSNPEIRVMLTRARDLFIDLKRRSALTASDQTHLEEVQAALDGLSGGQSSAMAISIGVT
jgi:serine/threonine protein kinase/tetratricopeptide (TPR) repeat protein